MKNGHIPLGTTILTPETQRPDFLRDHPDATMTIENPPYRTYRIGPVKIYDRTFFPQLTFVENRLRRVSLTADTNSWFGENIEAEKAKNDEWLKQSFGILADDTNYSWGGIGSVADYKTGGASIVVVYDRPEKSAT